MKEQDIIKRLERFYYPTWEPSLSGEELANIFKELCEAETGSKEYYRLKSELLKDVGMNVAEEYSREKDELGMETFTTLEAIVDYCLKKEIEGGVIK